MLNDGDSILSFTTKVTVKEVARRTPAKEEHSVGATRSAGMPARLANAVPAHRSHPEPFEGAGGESWFGIQPVLRAPARLHRLEVRAGERPRPSGHACSCQYVAAFVSLQAK